MKEHGHRARVGLGCTTKRLHEIATNRKRNQTAKNASFQCAHLCGGGGGVCEPAAGDTHGAVGAHSAAGAVGAAQREGARLDDVLETRRSRRAGPDGTCVRANRQPRGASERSAERGESGRQRGAARSAAAGPCAVVVASGWSRLPHLLRSWWLPLRSSRRRAAAC